MATRRRWRPSFVLPAVPGCVIEPDEYGWLWDFDGTHRRCVALDGSPPLPGTALTLEFDRERIHGSAGVNR